MEAQIPPESTSEEQTRSKLRERHVRRKQKRGDRQISLPGRPQLSPAGGFKMPSIPVKWSPIQAMLTGVGAIAFVAAVVFGLGLFKSAPPEIRPNAIWLGAEWTYEPREAADLVQLAQQLRDNEIGTVYAWVSWLQSDDTWNGAENFGAVRQFVTQFKIAYPEAQLFAWLRLPVNLGEDNYRLDDTNFQDRVADFSQTVISEFGFDGVFLNAEPILDNDANYLDMLRVVRATIGTGAVMAVATPPDWSPVDAGISLPPAIEPGTIWEHEYKQRVALLTDQMMIMTYNSGFTAPDEYAAWVAYQVEIFANAIAELDTSTTLVIGVPTYAEDLPAHNTSVENVSSAVSGIRAGLVQAGDAATFVQGVAVYAEWDTDATEWAQFNTEWVSN